MNTTRILLRLILGFTLAVPAFVLSVGRAVPETPTYTLVIRMVGPAADAIQVFYDDGHGFAEARSTTTWPATAHTLTTHRLQVPPGEYTALRIDPGTSGGTYVIEYVALELAGADERILPLSGLTPAHQLTAVEKSDGRLVLECPPGGNDPQLIYRPDAPIRLLVPWLPGRLGSTFALFVVVGALFVSAVGAMARRGVPGIREGIERAALTASKRPQLTILAVATAATIGATWPVVFMGRSFVSPNNGGTFHLYDQAPFVPGGHDSAVENTRGSDIYAMMWAFVPYANVQRDAVARREIPLWNRYNATGQPLWGQGQTFMMDPLHWLVLATDGQALGWDLKFVAHRLVFAWGTGLAVWLATDNLLAAGLAALAGPFAGVFAFRFNHPAAFTVTYAPWVLCCWFRLSTAPGARAKARAASWLGLTTALVLVASPPKEAIVVLAGCALAGTFVLLGTARSLGALARSVAAASIAGAVAVCVAAPHWLVFLHTLAQSTTTYDHVQPRFAGFPFAAGFFLGPLLPGTPLPALGPLILPLLIATLLGKGRSGSARLLLPCLLAALALFTVAFGAIPAAWLVRIPLFASIFHVDDAFMTGAVALVLVGSMLSVDRLGPAPTNRTIAVSAVTALVGAYSVWRLGLHFDRLEGWLAVFAFAAAACLPWAFAHASAEPRSVTACGTTAALLALLLLPSGLHVETGSPGLDAVLAQPRPRPDLDVNSPAVDVIRAAAAPTRVAGVDYTLIAGAQGLYELEGIGGPDALTLPGMSELLEASAPRTRHGGWLILTMQDELPREAPLFDMLNVGYLLARADNVPRGMVAEPVHGDDIVRPILRPTAWPRAFFVSRVSTYERPVELIEEARTRRAPFAAVLASDAASATLTRDLPRGSAQALPAADYELTVNTTRFRIRAPEAGVAVLGEAWMPDDFIATLNGRRVPYFRVNHVAKAVVIPGAGDWLVSFEYRPSVWDRSLAMAAIGALLAVALAGVGYLPVRRAHPARP